MHLLASSPPNASINEMAHCFRCSRSGRYARNIGNPLRRRSRALPVAQLLRLFSRRCFPGGSFKRHCESGKRIAAISPRPFRGEGSWRLLLISSAKGFVDETGTQWSPGEVTDLLTDLVAQTNYPAVCVQTTRIAADQFTMDIESDGSTGQNLSITLKGSSTTDPTGPSSSTCAPRAYANRTSRHAETASSPITQAPSTLLQSLGTCVLRPGSQNITQHKYSYQTEPTFPAERFPCGASPSRLHTGQRGRENQ